MDDSLSFEEFRPLLRDLMKRAYRNLEAGPDGYAGGCAEAGWSDLQKWEPEIPPRSTTALAEKLSK